MDTWHDVVAHVSFIDKYKKVLSMLRGPPGLANGKPEQCHNAPVGPLKDVFTN